MSYYRVCPDCGACLDPQEICDCHTGKAASGGPNSESGRGNITYGHYSPAKEEMSRCTQSPRQA